MADQQKIHPVDVEAPPPATAPLVPRGSSRSDKGDPIQQYPPPPPVYQRTNPVKHSKPPKKRSCFCRFLCWAVVLLVLQLVLVAITAGILFLVFRPKLPKYSIDALQISEFNINNDSSLYARFDVIIKARNPNKNIGIYYENGSRLRVYYTDTKLCEGSLPKFYQGHRNTTVLDVALTGQTQNGSSLVTALSTQLQETGIIPLRLRANVPVRVKLGSLKLWKVKFLVRCRLEVNSITANDSISIKSSSCKFRLRL